MFASGGPSQVSLAELSIEKPLLSRKPTTRLFSSSPCCGGTVTRKVPSSSLVIIRGSQIIRDGEHPARAHRAIATTDWRIFIGKELSRKTSAFHPVRPQPTHCRH